MVQGSSPPLPFSLSIQKYIHENTPDLSARRQNPLQQKPLSTLRPGLWACPLDWGRGLRGRPSAAVGGRRGSGSSRLKGQGGFGAGMATGLSRRGFGTALGLLAGVVDAAAAGAEACHVPSKLGDGVPVPRGLLLRFLALGQTGRGGREGAVAGDDTPASPNGAGIVDDTTRVR